MKMGSLFMVWVLLFIFPACSDDNVAGIDEMTEKTCPCVFLADSISVRVEIGKDPRSWIIGALCYVDLWYRFDGCQGCLNYLSMLIEESSMSWCAFFPVAQPVPKDSTFRFRYLGFIPDSLVDITKVNVEIVLKGSMWEGDDISMADSEDSKSDFEKNYRFEVSVER